MIKRGGLFLAFIMPLILLAQNRYWVSVSTANWSSNSWSNSSGGAPDGIGAPTGTGTAIFNSNGLGNCNLDVTASFNNIRLLTGYTSTIDLNGNSFNLNGASQSYFQDGVINDTPGTSSVNLNSTGAINFQGTVFNSSISGSASVINFNGGTFNNVVDIENNSTGSSSGSGGCIFNDIVTITNSGTGYFLMGNGSPDIFNGNLELINTSSSRIRIAYNSIGTQINQNLVVSNTGGGIWFGENGGTVSLASSKSISIGTGGFNANELRFKNFTQTGATAQNLSLTGTSLLRFQTGTVFNGDVNFDSPRMYLDGATFNGTSDFEKTGASSDGGIGGNTFIGNVILRNSGSGYFMLGNTTADIFNNDVTMFNTGTHGMYLGNNSLGNSIGGNLVLNNTPSGSSTVYLSSSSVSSLAITGNVELYNNGFSATQNVYLANGGDVTIGGNLLVENAMSGTTNSAQVYVASNSNSSLIISGSTVVKNGGTNTSSRVYLGNDGDVTFNGTLDIINSSSATNSEIHCNYDDNSSNTYNDNITVTSTNSINDGIYFGNSLGNGTLAANKTLTIGAGGFIGSYLQFRNFTQMGSTPQNIALTGVSRLDLNNSDWGGNLVFSAPRLYTRDSRYRGTAIFTKNGSLDDHSNGGNQFDLDFTMNNAGSGTFAFGNTNPDSFGNDVIMNNSGTSRVYIAYNAPGNTIARDLTITNSGSGAYSNVHVNSGSLSTLTIGRNCSVTNSASSTSSDIYIGDNGASTIIGGNLIVDNIASGTNGRVYLGQNNVFTLNGNLIINNSGTTSNGYVYLGNGSSSLVTINGTSTVTNTGGGNNRYVYLGNNGDVTFNDDLSILNASSAIYSRVYCNNSATSSNNYNGNITLENTNVSSDGIYFGSGSGSGILAVTKSVSLSAGGFVAGELYFKNFTQMGNTSHSIILDVTGTATFFNYDSDWGGDVVFSGPRMYTRGTKYRRTANLTKTGANNDYSVGGNVFYDDLTLTNSGSNSLYMGNGVADDFQGDLDVNNIGTSNTTIAYNSLGNTLSGNFKIINNPTSGSGSVYVSSSTASSFAISGNVTITNNGSATSQNVYFGRSGDVNVVGDLAIQNGIGTSGTSSQVYIGEASNSAIVIGGETSVLNGGVGNISRVYLGNNGDVIFNGNLSVKNSASANHSYIYCNNNVNSINAYNGNITLESTHTNTDGIYFGNGGGAGVLAATKTVSLSSGGFIAGQLYFRNFTQTGNTAHSIILDVLGTATFYNYDSDWGGDVVFSGPRMYTRGTNYRRTANLTKTGANSDYSNGGNVFYDDYVMNNSGSGYFLIGASVADDFQGNVDLNNTGSNHIYIAHNSVGNTIAGNLTATNTSTGSSSGHIYISQSSSAELTIAGNVTLLNNGTSNSCNIYFGDNGKVSSVGGNLLATNNTSGTSGYIYLASSDTLNVTGNLTINNIGSSTNMYVYLSNSINSLSTIGGATNVLNSGIGNVSRIYLANQGKVIYNGDVKLSNNSPSNNSHIHLNYNATSNSMFNENIIVESYHTNCDGILFGQNNGSATLAANKTVTVGANGFIAGELRFRNFTQLGTTAQTINLLAYGTGYFYNYDSDWGGNVNFSGPRMNTRGTTYRGTSYLEKTNSNNDASAGGNLFVGISELKNTGSAYFLMGNGNPDVFQADLIMNNLGSSHMYLGNNSAGNTIAGDFTLNNATIGTASTSSSISSSTSSTVAIAGNVILNNTSSATNGIIYLGNSGDVDVQGTLNIINNTTSTGTGGITIGSGSTSTVNLVGNLSILNSGSSNYSNIYLYYAGNGVVDGAVSITNNCTGNNGEVRIGTNSSSYATFNSTVDLQNSGGNNIRRMYIGYNGDLTFNDDITLSNSSTAIYSSCSFNYSSSSNNQYNGNVTLESYGTNCDGIEFGTSNGTGTLATGKALSLGSNGFTDGNLYFENFTQLGNTPQTITTTNNSRIIVESSLWNGDVTFISPRMHTRESIYNGITYLEKTGGTNDQSYGLNTYNDDVTFKNSGTGYFMPTNSNPNDHNGDVTYIKSSTGLLYPSYSATDTYAGDINIDANSIISLGASSGRVLMDGTSAQSINNIGAAFEPNFRRLRTNNLTNEITLNTPINIQTELDLIAGNIITDATNFITMRDNSTVATVSDNAYVDGPLQKIGNELFTFPVGKTGVYRPIEISAPSSSSAKFKAEFFATDPHLSGYNHALKDATLDHISNCEHWILDRENSTNNVNVKLYYDSYGTSSCSGVDNQSELAVARWDGTMWKDHGNGGFGGTVSDGWVTTSGAVTSFSPFTLASTSTNNPLPIELVSFTATENVDVVDLFWETASEIDNDYFTIERSSDGIEFETLKKVIGAGNSTQNIEYKTLDERPLNGVSYYRLKQTDFNGEFSYSEIEVVHFSKSNEISIYPNPVKAILTIDGLVFNDIFTIYSVDGKLIYTGTANTVNVEMFSNGVYQLVVVHENGTQENLKFVK